MVYSSHDCVMLFHTSPVVKNAPAHVGGTDALPGQGRSHTLWSNQAGGPHSRARARCSPCPATMRSSCSPQLEKATRSNNPSTAGNK